MNKSLPEIDIPLSLNIFYTSLDMPIPNLLALIFWSNEKETFAFFVTIKKKYFLELRSVS